MIIPTQQRHASIDVGYKKDSFIRYEVHACTHFTASHWYMCLDEISSNYEWTKLMLSETRFFKPSLSSSVLCQVRSVSALHFVSVVRHCFHFSILVALLRSVRLQTCCTLTPSRFFHGSYYHHIGDNRIKWRAAFLHTVAPCQQHQWARKIMTLIMLDPQVMWAMMKKPNPTWRRKQCRDAFQLCMNLQRSYRQLNINASFAPTRSHATNFLENSSVLTLFTLRRIDETFHSLPSVFVAALIPTATSVDTWSWVTERYTWLYLLMLALGVISDVREWSSSCPWLCLATRVQQAGLYNDRWRKCMWRSRKNSKLN